MSDTPENNAPADNPPPVEQQRQELAETADALVAKLDVPARVNDAASKTPYTARVKAQENQAVLVGAAVSAVLAVGGIIILCRRRRG